MIQYFDTHTHLFDAVFQNDLPDVIERAREAGVAWFIVPATDLATSRAAIQLADSYENIFAAVGVHPHEAAAANDAVFKELEELVSHPKVVAIGEIGLDYHYNFSPVEKQKDVFIHQLQLSAEKNKPVIIHTREAMADTRHLVDDVLQKNPQWNIGGDKFPGRGVFHCFPGTAAEARELRSQGFWVSFPGIVTFKKSSALDVVMELGHEQILLETDSPYMTPVPFRGTRNESMHLPLIGKKIAEALSMSEEEVASATTRNAKKLFGLP